MSALLEKLASLPKEKRAELLAKYKNGNAAEKVNTAKISPVLPLSATQKRLWMLYEFGVKGPMYNMASAFKMEGNIDLGKLKLAIECVVNSHDVLRARFSLDEDLSPIQTIEQSGVVVDVPVIKKSESDVKNTIHKFCNQPFDLLKDDLYRFQLLQVTENECYLLVNIHHIVADGWSIQIISKEVARNYELLLAGETVFPRNSHNQFSDFIPLSLSELSEGNLDEKRRFWQSYLDGAPPLLELPLDFARPSETSHSGSRIEFKLSKSEREALETLSKKLKVSLFVLLMGAFKVLLARYTNSKDIVIGTPVANRSSRWEETVGMFVNTLAVRSKLEYENDFSSFLTELQKNWLSAFARKSVPFEMIIEDLNVSRSLSHAPLVQNIFSLHDARNDQLNLSGMSVSKVDVSIEETKFDLLMALEINHDGFSGWVEYNDEIYSENRIKGFVGSYRMLLKGVLNNPSENVLQLPIVSEKNFNSIYENINNTAQKFSGEEKLLHELFLDQANKTPETVAVIFNDQRFTYQDIRLRAGELAYHLRNDNVKPNELVAVICNKGVEQIIGVLGVLFSGAAYLPIETDWPKERVESILDRADVSVIITQNEISDKFLFDGKYIVRDLDACKEIQPGAATVEDIVQTNEDFAYVIFTSGSTGEPKGVVIQHFAAVNTILDINERYNVASNDRVLAVSALSFDLSVYDIFGLLATGGCIVIPSDEHKNDPSYWYELAVLHEITLWNSVPAIFQMISEYAEIEQKDLPESLRWCFMSGDWIPLELPTRAMGQSKNLSIHSGGGATEGSIWSITYPIKQVDPSWTSIPYGLPLANQKFYVLNDKCQPCPIGVTGNLYIGGKGVAHSYWKDEQKTAERFIYHKDLGERLYFTGDLGRISPEGYIEFIGRADFQVKINGYRVELGEIESAVKKASATKNVIVSIREISEEKRIIAYLVYDKEINITKVDSRVRELIPSYMIPDHYLCVNSIPLTANGKVDQKKLPLPEESVKQNKFSPRSDLDIQVKDVFCEILELESLGIDDNFFELGGHSLSASRLVARIRKELSVDFRVRDLLHAQSVRLTSDKIEAMVRKGDENPITKVTGPRDFQLASSVQRGLWIQCQLDQTSAAYNMPAAIMLSGDLNVERLQSSFSKLVSRHEALRTNYEERDGEIYQVIRDVDANKFELSRIDLTDLDKDERAVILDQKTRENASQEFDLEKDSLIRGSIVKLSDESHCLLICVHHLNCDGWSFAVLLNELSRLYRGNEPTLPDVEYQYIDYSNWKSKWEKSEEYTSQLEFWLKELKGTKKLTFSFETKNENVSDTQGTTIPFSLSKQASEKIDVVAKNNGITPFVLLLTLFKSVIHSLSDQDDIVVATTTASRPTQHFENTVGLFANQVLIRSNWKRATSIQTKVAEVNEAVRNAIVHQDIPYADVASKYYSTYDTSESLFRVKFVFQNDINSEVQLPGLKTTARHQDNGLAKFDILMIMDSSSENLTGTLQYKNKYFNAESIQALLNSWIDLINDAENIRSLQDIKQHLNVQLH